MPVFNHLIKVCWSAPKVLQARLVKTDACTCVMNILRLVVITMLDILNMTENSNHTV